MNSYGGYGSTGSGGSTADKAQMLEQLKNQMAVANAQELVQKMTNKCFLKCVSYPGSALDKKQQGCMSNCVERYMESWNIVSKSYSDRMQRERGGVLNMEGTNVCAVLKCKGDLQLEQRPVPKPGKGEVLLQMKSVGICGSDVHYWTHGSIGDFIVKSPMVMGHEASGVVIGLGKGVTTLQVGDRVAIEPGVPCRTCSYCKGGRYNLCPDMRFCATPPIDGSLANYYVHAADFCYKLPDHVSFDEGALLEPLSVGVHACNRAGVTLGSKVLICGAGPIGLVCLLTALACGASEVAITDIDTGRLEVAKKLGAKYAIHANTRDSRAMADRIADIMGCRPDKTIECSGAQPAIATGIYATRSGGVLVLVGLGAAEVSIPIVDASVREVDIRGIFRYCNCYPKALEMIASGKVNVKPLVTHEYKLKETLDAFERARTGEGGAIKVMIHVEDNE